jgi:hypothetical protein
MVQNRYIRFFLASFMLVVFAFSITPQKNIHDFVAKHIDPTTCSVHVNLPIEQLENTSIHCSFDQLVATTPFVYYDFSIVIKTIKLNPARNTVFEAAPIVQYAIVSDSRGPPAC